MARIKLVDEKSGRDGVAEIFKEIIERAGRVPAAYRAFANHPHILQANWNRTKNILGCGNVDIVVKESIATRVSKVNGCHFCLEIHRANLAKLEVDEDVISSIELGKPEDPKLSAVLNFVSTATQSPENLTDEDFASLRAMGYSEEDILEILTVMEMYTGYNKIIVALDLQTED